MEDQQPGTGDLTDSDAEVADAAPATATNAADEGEATGEPAAPQAKESWLGRHKAQTLIGGAAAAFVVTAAFAGGALEPYLSDRAEVATKLDIARTSVDAITALWTYTPQDMDKLAERSSKYLTGDLQNQYRKFVDAIAATNKQAQVTNTTQVVAAAVESLQGSDATALVYTNTESTSPKGKIPTVKYLSYRLDLKRKGTHWLVTKMTTVTSLDLTPKL